MEEKKKQITKISIFIASIFVILFSVTYAFITQIITGTKEVVINAGVLDLVLEEENAITISDALPMYDEVGMIQEPFAFKLINNGSNPVNYKLKLIDLTPQTAEFKCSDYGKITLDSPPGCRKTIYPNELRQEALALCQTLDPSIVSEQDCLTAMKMMGYNYLSYEEFMDEGIKMGAFTDTRRIEETYPDKTVDVSVGELYWDILRYGLTKNGENTIAYINELKNRIRIEDLEVREKVLAMCKSFYPSVTDEASCLEVLQASGAPYETFDEIIIDSYNFNGGVEFILDAGKINGNETINYDLRLWISEYVEQIEDIERRKFSFRIDVEVSQEKQLTVSDLVSDDIDLGINCNTYNDGFDTFLVGICPNNYVWYSGKLWRVVLKNNETGALKMVTDNSITSIPYNAIGSKSNNVFENSFVDQWLNQEFLPTLHDYSDYLVVDSVWDATASSKTTPRRPDYSTQVTRTVGLLNSYENYTTYYSSNGLATSKTGYLNNSGDWWLMTPYFQTNPYEVWMSNSSDGRLVIGSGSYAFGVRPSVNLKSEIPIFGGSGKKTDPYILEGDIHKPINGTTQLSKRYSGEYITFNNVLYRIVDIENGLTKIIAVDVPNSLSNIVFHSESDEVSFADASIKSELERYYQNMKTTDESFYNMIEPNTTWYLGSVGQNSTYHYKGSICANIDENVSMNLCEEKVASTTANIGLPRIGEMFTSQITRGTKLAFWTLTRISGYINCKYEVDSEDYSQASTSTYSSSIRPSMYLKSNVVIASNNTGNGTYEKPYSIELGQ